MEIESRESSDSTSASQNIEPNLNQQVGPLAFRKRNFTAAIGSVPLAMSDKTRTVTDDQRSSSVKKPKKRVSFVAPSIDRPPTTHASPSASSHGIPNMEIVTDICKAINSNTSLKRAVGYLQDENESHHRHDIYFLGTQIRRDSDPRSLESVLQLSRLRRPGFVISRRDRLYIALTLASSVLQLDSTCWLKKRWRSSDILFWPLEERMAKTQGIDISRPYVSWQIKSGDSNGSLVAAEDQSFAARQIRNEYLFALGCILIELSLNQKLSDSQIREDVQPNEVLTDFNTAMRLVNEVYDENGTRYGDAVQRCLTCPFNLRDLRNFGLDNEEFQGLVFDHIVTPLRQDFEAFSGGQGIK